MAAALVLSPKTVEKHVAAVLRKTGTVSRIAAVMTALDRGLAPGPDARTRPADNRGFSPIHPAAAPRFTRPSSPRHRGAEECPCPSFH